MKLLTVGRFFIVVKHKEVNMGGVVGKGKMVNRRNAVMSNVLINASYSLSLSEKRVILLILADIEHSKNVDIETWYSMSAASYASLCNVNLHAAYTIVKDAAGALFERHIVTKENGYTTKFRWVTSIPN